MAIRKKICTSPSSVHGCSSWLWENNYLTVHLTYTHPNLLFHWSLSPALPIVFRDKGIVISPSLLFSQPITNPVWNGCRSPPYNSHSQVTFSARKYLRLCWREGWGVDVVVLSTFGIHIFFEIGKDHYWDITMFFLSLRFIYLFF